MKKQAVLTMCFLLAALGAQARERLLFDADWLFTLNPKEKQVERADFNDAKWRRLTLPHDWAVEGSFSASNASGAGGGALPGGMGWYRKHFKVSPGEKYDKYFIEFDGVYMNSSVYINGHLLGTRPYGYSSFEYDLTPYLNRNGDNVIAVKVDNTDQPNSRWYSGCGIYRHVWLTKTAEVHVAHWGTHVQPTVEGKRGRVNVTVTVAAEASSVGKRITVRNMLLDAQGKVAAQGTSQTKVAGRSDVTQTLALGNPHLWSVERPYVYTVKTELLSEGRVVDTYLTTTGFRSFRFDADHGFFLNGKPMKLNGVCEHHDFGCLGAALSEDAMHRKLLMLKRMGCNALRCSHNPPAPELLNMCDTMGLVVMDESFDMWRRRKTKNDYARFFDKWYERDLTDLVVRDRNHPSVMIWSIGNEVLEQWSSASADNLTLEQANLILNMGHDPSTLANDKTLSVNSLLTQRLAEVIHKYDTTRPVTAGCNEPKPTNHLFKSGAIDLIGFNYHDQNVKDFKKNFPGKPFLFTESVSALQSRGYYTMPSDSVILSPSRWDRPWNDPSYQCSSYDNQHAPWGTSHEHSLDVVKHTPFCSGQFLWTGYDYIGEPTPYGYPSRSSYFGVIDLAGFPKDAYWLYKSEWSSEPVLHLFPHWNWIDGQTVDLWCYYNQADEVELFVNGVSAGVRKKADSHQFHVMWRVVYHPGTICVVARKNGKEVRRQTVRTAGAPHHLRFTPEQKELKADGKSLCFVQVEVVDKDGTLCPHAENQLFFSVDGPARIAGVDNGNAASMERFKDNKRKAFAGKCLVVLQSTGEKGQIALSAKGIDLQESRVLVETK